MEEHTSTQQRELSSITDMEDNYIYLDELNEQSAPSGASIVYAPQGGKPGYRVKKPDGTLGQWIPVDKSQLNSPGLKATQIRYDELRLKKEAEEARKQAEKLGDAPARETGVPRGQLPPGSKSAPAPAPAKPAPAPEPAKSAPAKSAPTPEKKYQFTVGDKSFDLTKAQINQTYRDPKALGGLSAVDFGRAANQAIYQFKKPGPSNLMKRYTQPSVEKEAYDVVLDYLLSEGHAETVEEAHYVMMQLDSEHIQSIVESGYFPTPESQRADEAKYKLSRDRLPGEHKPVKGKPPTKK